ncbi:hypothetical protein HMPREF1380_02062 [Enterococcus faecium R499]|nr:hypothetical protein HMPREF1380_02062 [Enterococcus faecium R499]EJY00663.1 hypothetical protein HMPREF1363_01807 [Enterococcus faecium ERV161]EJY04213.1 hypothetical protein HMPREF1362_01405 [Enterococcus faecium ERV102]
MFDQNGFTPKKIKNSLSIYLNTQIFLIIFNFTQFNRILISKRMYFKKT